MPLQASNLYYIWCSYIEPQHEKISICACPEAPYFFWVNTDPRSHGIGQVPWPSGITNGVVCDCYADLSCFKMFAPKDIAKARDMGPLSEPAKALILAELATPIATLAEAYRQLALRNLT